MARICSIVVIYLFHHLVNPCAAIQQTHCRPVVACMRAGNLEESTCWQSQKASTTGYRTCNDPWVRDDVESACICSSVQTRLHVALPMMSRAFHAKAGAFVHDKNV